MGDKEWVWAIWRFKHDDLWIVVKFNCNFSNEEVNKGGEDERWKALLSRQGAFCFGEGWYYPTENGSFFGQFLPRGCQIYMNLYKFIRIYINLYEFI